MHQLQTEIGLLVRELKERDRELTSMLMSHQQQQACWNRDREAVLMLRDELASVEEKSMVTDRELRNLRVCYRVFRSLSCNILRIIYECLMRTFREGSGYIPVFVLLGSFD